MCPTYDIEVINEEKEEDIKVEEEEENIRKPHFGVILLRNSIF